MDGNTNHINIADFVSKETIMRGIYTSVTDIRRKVFTEVARMAYEGGDYAKKIEQLPYKILPGELASYRESIFL